MNFKDKLEQIVKFDNTVYSEHIYNVIDSMSKINRYSISSMKQHHYKWILDYYEL